MPYMKGRQPAAFTVMVIFLTLMHTCKGQSQVISPSQRILATVGDDITLPCHLKPAQDALGMTVEWTRPDRSRTFVLVWRNGEDMRIKKDLSYKGRSSMSIERLKHGDVSLKLSKVKLSDEGAYRCFLPDLLKESTVGLVVGAVSSPVVNMSRNSSVVELHCESGGWYPRPEVLWLDGEGKLLSAGPTETVRGPDDLYTVSSRLTVENRLSNNFTCRVHQNHINQTRDTHITVPGSDQPASSSSSAVPAIIGVIVGFIFCLAVVFIAVWKCRQNKLKKKNHHEDEETQKVGEKRNSANDDPERESLMKTERETRRNVKTEEETEEERIGQQVFEGERQGQQVVEGQGQKVVEGQGQQVVEGQGQQVVEGQGQKVVEGQGQQVVEGHGQKVVEGQGQQVVEGERQEQRSELEAEKETELDKKKEKHVKQLQKTNREENAYEKRVSRYLEHIKEVEEKIKEVSLQLEETERKLQSVNNERDKMEPGTQKEAAEEEKRLLHTKNDLEMKKEELQKALPRIMSNLTNATKNKQKIKEKEEINKKLKEIEKQEKTEIDSDDDL